MQHPVAAHRVGVVLDPHPGSFRGAQRVDAQQEGQGAVVHGEGLGDLQEPELVILDEPMSGLDPIGRRDVRDLILAQRAAGRTVFFSSHILQDAEMLCDRVAIVFKGKLRSVGKLDDLVARDAKWIEISVRGLLPADLPGTRTTAPDGTTLLRVDGVPSLTKVLAAVPAAGGEVLSVWPRRESLEDLFLREIGRAKAEERAS